MVDRVSVGSGAPWEGTVGYSRAVRVGHHVAVAGTTSTASDGTVLCPGDAHGQALAALEIIERALARVGATMADVVRTRMYLVRIEDFDAVGRAHGSVFGEIRPASTMVQIAGLVDPAHLVEIEVDAIVDDTPRRLHVADGRETP
jgi:enamine deaminase RidA (YjgF/YER057c/UK114 family)